MHRLIWVFVHRICQKALLLVLRLIPAKTQRRNNVASLSWRCSYIVTMLQPRLVFDGIWFLAISFSIATAQLLEADTRVGTVPCQTSWTSGEICPRLCCWSPGSWIADKDTPIPWRWRTCRKYSPSEIKYCKFPLLRPPFWYCLKVVLLASGLDPSLVEHDMPFLSKQCRSRSVGFRRSQLIWICTVCL